MFMKSNVLQKAKYAFNCDSCGKFNSEGTFYLKFIAVSGKKRYYCEQCANESFKHYSCQECGKKWTIFKTNEEGWDDFEWIDYEKRIYKYDNKWLCYECYRKKVNDAIRKNPDLFIEICERNKPQENYRFYKLISIIDCKYYFNCGLAINYGYCKEMCKVTCDICGKEMRIEVCHVHHKRKLPKGSNQYKYENPENLSIICASCHKKEELNLRL